MGDLNWLQWMRWLRDINFPVMNLLWRRPVMIVMWMATHPNNRCLFPFWFPVKCIFCWRWRLVRHSVFLLAIGSSILEVQGHRSGALAQLAVWVVSLSIPGRLCRNWRTSKSLWRECKANSGVWVVECHTFIRNQFEIQIQNIIICLVLILRAMDYMQFIYCTICLDVMPIVESDKTARM